MKVAGILQAVIILLLLASAASCEVSKEYANRVFRSQPVKKTDSTLAIKFMQFDSGNASDSINLADVFKKESNDIDKDIKDSTKAEITIVKAPAAASPVVAETKKMPKDISSGTVRTKKVRQ